MTDLQLLVRQTSDSVLRIQLILLQQEVAKLGKSALELKESNKRWAEIVEQKDRDWLTICQETDETIAALKAEVEAYRAAQRAKATEMWKGLTNEKIEEMAKNARLIDSDLAAQRFASLVSAYVLDRMAAHERR